MDGLLVVRKEKGYTSHDVVAKLRGILHMKRIGHAGTLDPEAEGVLLVTVGKGTRLTEMLTEKDKTYEAVLRLGIETDTQDMTGQVLRRSDVEVSPEELRSVIAGFEGEQMQVPPMYSAVKVGGKKLYELAREGRSVERAPRPVWFREIGITEIAVPRVRFRVTCSKGAYIRTLCHDIGRELGCGACMEELLRLRAGRFTLEESVTLDQVREAAALGKADTLLYGLEEMLAEYPRVLCRPEADHLLQNGNPLDAGSVESAQREGQLRMCTSGGAFVGLYGWDPQRERYYPVRMFV